MSAVKVGSVIAEELRKVILDKHGLTSSAGSTHDVYYKEISGRKNVEFNIYMYIKKGCPKKGNLVCLSVCDHSISRNRFFQIFKVKRKGRINFDIFCSHAVESIKLEF